VIDRVLLDMDSVLVNLVGGVCSRFGWTYPTSLTDHTQRKEQTSYYLNDVFDVTDADIWPHLGREFWADLEPLPWAFDVIKALERRWGENICLLTAPVETDGAIDGKRDWIKSHTPQFRHRQQIGTAKWFCASPHHVLIDDHEKNCAEFRTARGHTFLFPAPWNRRFQEDAGIAIEEWIRALEVLDKSRL
jgi:5'(3')-deoxyribonucleotidase